MTGRVVHFEVPFDDQERAGGFYSEVFGWATTPMPEMSYVMVSTGPSAEGPPSEAGFINGGMLQRKGPLTGPVLVLEVDDIDDVLEKIEARGGSTVSGREAVGEMGFSAYFTDSEGNLMGLWQNV